METNLAHRLWLLRGNVANVLLALVFSPRPSDVSTGSPHDKQAFVVCDEGPPPPPPVSETSVFWVVKERRSSASLWAFPRLRSCIRSAPGLRLPRARSRSGICRRITGGLVNVGRCSNYSPGCVLRGETVTLPLNLRACVEGAPPSSIRFMKPL